MPPNTSQYRTEAPPNTPIKRAWATTSRLSRIQLSDPSSPAQDEATPQSPSPPRPGCRESITVRLAPEDPALQEVLHYAAAQGWVNWSADYTTLHLSLQQAQNELADINTDRENIYQREKELDASKRSLKAREEAVAVMEKGMREQHRVMSLKMLELASTVGAQYQASPSRGPGRGQRRREAAARPRVIWDEKGTGAGPVYPQREVPGVKWGRFGRKKWWEFWNRG